MYWDREGSIEHIAIERAALCLEPSRQNRIDRALLRIHWDREGSIEYIGIERAALCTELSRQIRLDQIRIEALLRIHTLGFRGLFWRIY